MRPISCVLCTVFALLTVLSFVPAIMLLCTCLFSSACVLHNFEHAMAFPGLHRKLAIVMVVAPPLATLSYVLMFWRCYRSQDVPEDVLNRGYRSLD
jgi:flagellar biosynthesis protein FliP